MGASARAGRRWRAIAFLALPGLVMVAADRAGATPPEPTPPTGGFSATPLTPSTDPPASSVPGTPPATDPPVTEPAPPTTEVTPTEVPSTDAPVAPEPSFTAETLTPYERVTGSRAPTSRLAETDPALLGRTDAEPVEVLVKLDYDSIATYAGDIEGLPATSPSVTGRDLTRATSAEVTYDSYIAGEEQSFAADLQATVPEATIGEALRTVYGGVRAVVPANRVADIAALPNVVAVQQDEMRQLLTDSSRDFIGATSLYPALGGDKNAGRGVIFGVLDSGAWPEHPSLADQGNLGRPPRRFGNTPRPCNFGDNPLTPAVDVFVCNNKLIGGQAFLSAYLSNPARAAAEVYKTARDSNGHGTHTGTTSAGNVLASAPVLGVDRGPLGGIAPGAWVSVYKVCGAGGCFSSDSAAAVQQAIYDGVDVINFSISGGTNPATDPVELAFLDAYAAGVFVSASAGNDGPGAATANHLSPWTTTVAASTQTRAFESTLTVTGPGGATATYTGASITAGVTTPTAVVMASAAPYNDALCQTPAPAGLFAGKIVACQRGGNARVDKGYNVRQGGAVGMILYNPALADVETDNHWLPTVHLADGTAFVAFMAANPGATASFTAGTKAEGQGDVMAAFSSRGPAGAFIKPDVTAPGVEILAGQTPTPESITEGPPGQYFQAIAGTSMSSPHVAGAAILLKALHPTWTPGQIKSALMTTATTEVVKEDLVTPADPFDLGAGRIDLTVAGNPGLTFDASAADMIAYGTDPLTAVHLNQPSINVPVLPGRIETTRVATNVSGQRVRYTVEADAPDGSSIVVTPRRLNLAKNQSATLDITISSLLNDGVQQFGEIRLVPQGVDLPTLHLPVAFVPEQGDVTLASECAPDTIARGATSYCTITAENTGSNPVVVDLTTSVNSNLTITGAQNATVTRGLAAKLGVELAGTTPGIPSIGPGETPAGFLPLSIFGIAPEPIGDEDLLNFDVPAFVYAGATYTTIGVDSNGYVVVGGGEGIDNECCQPVIPDTARPNNVLAPLWTDLDGTGAPGLYAGILTSGTDRWLVLEWQVNSWGTTTRQAFQMWIGLNGEEDISYAYDPTALPTNPDDQPLVVGAESIDGSAGDSLGVDVLPTEDLRVVSTEPLPGGSVSYEVFVRGDRVGDGLVTTEMVSADLFGTTVVETPVTVTRR
jgi:hypothetical protein